MVDNAFARAAQFLDIDWLVKHTEALWRLERGQRTSDQQAAAQYAEQLMHDAGLAQVERITFPADGATTYLDCTMPMAWEVTCGRLEITRSPTAFSDPVVADYQRHPFHLVYGSVSTPPEGQAVRLVTEEQLFGGLDARGTMIVLDAETHPRSVLPILLDRGALGFVSTGLRGQYQTPDAVQWLNACTEGQHWHVHDDDRPFIGFSVSPRTGDALRAACRRGEVCARVTSDGRRFAGAANVVTGILPGEDPREIWLIAHLAEPLADDNAIGVAGSIALARLLRQLIAGGAMPAPRFTLRLVFGMELYGITAFAARQGGCLRGQALGAMNLDGVPVLKHAVVNTSPPALPFFGDYFLLDQCRRHRRSLGFTLAFRDAGHYGDDNIGNDPTIGLPTLWCISAIERWHNSSQDMSIFDLPVVRKFLAMHAAWCADMLTLRPETAATILRRAQQTARRQMRADAEGATSSAAVRWACERELARFADFRRVLPAEMVEQPLARLRQYADRVTRMHADACREGEADLTPVERMAASMVPMRATIGFPHDLRRIPKFARRPLPDQAIYGPFTNLIADIDGKRTLLELCRQTELEIRRPLAPAALRRYLGAIELLSEHGYLRTEFRMSLDNDAIVAAMRQAGVMPGDLLLVHSALSAIGHVEGGVDTVIDALLEAVGADGTLLMPTFTNSVIYMQGEPLSHRGIKPFKATRNDIWVGQIPGQFLQRPGVQRSLHPTHAVAGCGPLAAACLQEHRETDPPTGRSSPFGKLLEHGGKMAWLGAGLASTTFFHFLEDEMNLPYLHPAVCLVEETDGSLRPVLAPKHLPGHRDFYQNPGEETKMYRRLLQDGLNIAGAPLGFTEVKVIEARQMYDLGMRALAEDPNLMLCDDPACRFCSEGKVS